MRNGTHEIKRPRHSNGKGSFQSASLAATACHKQRTILQRRLDRTSIPTSLSVQEAFHVHTARWIKMDVGTWPPRRAAGARPALVSSAFAADPVFKVPPLGYGYDALEPYIDTLTMTIHHDKPSWRLCRGLEWARRKISRTCHHFARRTSYRSHDGAGSGAGAGAQQSRRPLEPLLLLGADDAGRRQGAGGRPKNRDRLYLWLESPAHRESQRRRDSAASVPAGRGLSLGRTASLRSSRRPIRTRRSNRGFSGWCWASMCGNTPIISNIRTSEPIISRRGGTPSIGTRRRRILPRGLCESGGARDKYSLMPARSGGAWRSRSFASRLSAAWRSPGCSGGAATRKDRPPISAILPIKLLDPGFETAQASMFAQDYPAYEVLIGAAEQASPALDAARSIAAAHPDVPCRFVLSAGAASGQPKTQ